MTSHLTTFTQLTFKTNCWERENTGFVIATSIHRWILEDESPRSGLAVLEVAVPTGYIVQQQNLDAYVRWLAYQSKVDYFTSNIRPVSQGSRPTRQEHGHRLQRARFTENKVFFYFDYVSFVNGNHC
jgi:hypothetical protein